MHGEEMAATYQRITLTGTLEDALGESREITDIFDNLPEWLELLQGAKLRFVDEPPRWFAKELSDALGKPNTPLAKRLGEIAQAVTRRGET